MLINRAGISGDRIVWIFFRPSGFFWLSEIPLGGLCFASEASKSLAKYLDVLKSNFVDQLDGKIACCLFQACLSISDQKPHPNECVPLDVSSDSSQYFENVSDTYRSLSSYLRGVAMIELVCVCVVHCT